MSDSAAADDYQDYIEQSQQAASAPVAPALPTPTQGIPSSRWTPPTPGDTSRWQPPGQAAAPPPQDAPDAQLSTIGPAEKPAGSNQGTLKDFGDQVWTGVLGLGQDAVGAARFANQQLGADPTIAAHLDAANTAVTDHIAATIGGMSATAQQAMHASIFNDGSDPNAPTWGQAGYVRTAAATIAGLVPQIALALIPGTVIGKVAVKLATLAGAGADVAGVAATAATATSAATDAVPAVTGLASKIGTAASAATTAGSFGTTDAGQAWNQIVDGVDKATPEQMAQSPVYQHLRDTGLSDIDARKQLLSTPGLAANVAMHFAAGAVAGSGVGGLLKEGALGAAGRGVLARTAIGAGEGGVVMGGQAGADTALGQQAGTITGTGPGYDASETAKAVAGGFLGGALMGGVAGVIHGRPDTATKLTGPNAAGMNSDVAAALNEQLPQPTKQGELDLSQVSPGAPAGQAQGDMFRTTQQANPGSGPGKPMDAVPGARPQNQRAGDAPTPPGRLPMTDTASGPAPSPPPPPSIDYAATQTQARAAGMAPGATQAPSDLRPAAPIADPRTGATPGSQGELFRERSAGDSPSSLPLTDGRPSQPPPAAGSPPEPPPTPPPIPPAPASTMPTGVKALRTALIGLGEKAPDVNRLKADDLQRRWQSLQPAVGDAGQKTPDLVSPPSARSAVADTEPGGRTSSTDPVDTATPANQAVSAPAGSSGLPEPKTAPKKTTVVKADVRSNPDVSSVEPTPEVKSNPVVNPVEPTPEVKPLTKGEQLRADATAKRAQQKARLAEQSPKPLASGKAYVDTGEAVTPKASVETKPAPVEETRTPVQVISKIRDAATKAARSQGLSEDMVKSWMSDVAKVIQGTHSEIEAHEALAKWGEEKTPAAEGSKIQRPRVADQMMRLLTGKGLDSRRALNDEIRGEAGKDRSVYEDQGVARGDITEHDAPASDTTAGGEKTRAIATTNKERILSDLEQKIREGSLDVTQAEARYGEQPKGPGAPRKFKSVVEYLTKRLAAPAGSDLHEADPAVRDHIATALSEHQKETADPVGYALARENARTEAAEAKASQADLARQQEIRSRAVSNETLAAEREAEHAPAPLDNAEAARKARVAAMQARMAAEGKPLYRRVVDRPREDALTPASSRYAQAVNEPRINNFLRDQVSAREAAGGTYGLHEGLDAIIQHASGPDAGPMRALATNLRKWAPNLPVRHAEMGEGVEGAYYRNTDGTPGHIALNPDGSDHVQTLLHEALHTVTADHIDHLLDADPNHPELQALRAIGDELRGHGGVGADAPTNPHELHTELLTNPELQKFAASRVASPDFRARMRELGFPPREQGRSVWQSFKDWMRNAVGLPKVASASEDTLLDHIMRPLQDITQRAIEHNAREGLPQDPVLRAQAEPLYRTVSSTMGDAGDKMRAAIPSRGAIMDKLRPALLAASTTDAIHTWNKALFDKLQNFTFSNPLTRYRDANEAVQHSTKAFHNQFGDRADGLVKQSQGLSAPERATLGQLMNEATIGNVRLGAGLKADANDHLTAKQQAKLPGLQARFDALNDKQKTLYSGMRDYYRETDKVERAAELKGVLTRAFPDATEAQREAFAKGSSTNDGFAKFLADPDNSDIAKSYGDEWGARRSLAVNLAKALDVGRVKGDYFQLGRFGNYVVKYGEKDAGTYGVEMFEHRGEADARRAELASQGVANLDQVAIKDQSAMREMMRADPLANAIHDGMKADPSLKAHADEVQDMINKILLRAHTRSETARVARKGIAGASVDFPRVMARDFVNTASRVGHMEHGGERYKALSDMRLVARDLERNGAAGEGIAARQVGDELEKKATTQDDDGGILAGAARTANSFGYVQSLMSFSHMLTSSIEAHMNSTSLLGGRHGLGNTSLALGKAMREIAPTMIKTGAVNTMKAFAKGLKAADWDLANHARDRLIQANPTQAAGITKLFTALDRAGLGNHTQAAEMRRIANPSGVATSRLAQGFQRFSNTMNASAHATDVMNKSVIAKAAFDLEMRKSGGDVDHSVAYAVEQLRQVTPNYNLGNKARVTTSRGFLGHAAAPVTQFKNYGLHMYGVMGNLVKASMNGATPQERWEAKKQFAGVLATHAMMAGSLTLIADPLRYIGGLWDYFTSTDHKPHDREAAIRGWMDDTFGKEAGEVLARGVPQALGIDLHRRVGLANLLEMPDLPSFDTKGVGAMMGQALMGAAGQDAGNAMKGFSQALHGDILGGIKALAPRPVRDVISAIGLSSQGVTDSGGKSVLPASSITPLDVGAQALGFQPSRVSEFREGREAVIQAQQDAKDEHAQLEQRWLAAKGGDKAAVMSEIRVFSQKHPAMRITVDQLMKLQAAAKKPTGPFGLKMNPAQAKEFGPAGAFANQ